MRTNLTICCYLAAAGVAKAAKSTGCGQALSKDLTKGETGHSNSLTFKTTDGTEREYLLHVPDSYDINTPAGLIWSFHGRGKDGEHQERLTGFSNSSANPDHLVVYPQGEPESGGKSSSKRAARKADEDSDEYGEYGEYEGLDDEGDDEEESGKGGAKRVWQGDPNAQTDDVNFTLELLDHISSTFCIDDDKVYASGMSNGGGFVANILACDANASSKFAAFASASGAYYQKGEKGDCDAEKVPIKCDNNNTKVALITTAGGKDKTIPYKGGNRRKACLPSVQHFMSTFAQHDGLSTTPSQSKVDSTDVVHYSFGQDASLGMVQSYYVPDLGHKWPTGNRKTYISATKIFMEFFADWNRTARDTAASTLPESGSGSDSSSTSKAAAQMRISSCQSLGFVIALLAAMILI